MNIAAKRPRRLFYTVMGLAISVIVIIGFSRTYYLRAWFDARPLTPRLHLHGLTLTLWLLLFLIQSGLIAARRRSLHKKLGIAGVVLAGLAVATTYAAALEAAEIGRGHSAPDYLGRLYSSLLLATMFGLFVAAGTAFRQRPDTHKRLMLLAMIAAVGPGANRAVALLMGHSVRDFHVLVIAGLVSAGLVYDSRTRGRPHPTLLWGGAFLIATQLTRRLVGASEPWAQIGSWLIR
jgi:hypothetical protein